MKKKLFKTGFMVFLATILFFTGLNISSPAAKAEETKEVVDVSKLDFTKVKPEKVKGLKQKIKEGKKLDADIYIEKMSKKDEQSEAMATSEDPYFRKDFPDGSFIESQVEDVTEEENTGLITPYAVEQIGGTSEYRTIKVSQSAIWGYESFRVKIYFPLGANAKILQAYEWYYIGAVNSVDYRGIYRASETATADAVAIQRLVIGYNGLNYVAKLDFRIRDGRYWSAYSS